MWMVRKRSYEEWLRFLKRRTQVNQSKDNDRRKFERSGKGYVYDLLRWRRLKNVETLWSQRTASLQLRRKGWPSGMHSGADAIQTIFKALGTETSKWGKRNLKKTLKKLKLSLPEESKRTEKECPERWAENKKGITESKRMFQAGKLWSTPPNDCWKVK